MMLGIMLYKAILTFESGCGILNSVIIQMKAAEQYFPVVLCNMWYRVVLTLKSLDEILKCDLLSLCTVVLVILCLS